MEVFVEPDAAISAQAFAVSQHLSQGRPFPAQDYYDRASASRVADKIAVPTLVVHSTDDPFIRMLPETRAKFLANPHVTLVETRQGGHCAFLAHPNGYDGRWAERQMIQFFLRHGMA